jgi:Lhr-like helicase
MTNTFNLEQLEQHLGEHLDVGSTFILDGNLYAVEGIIVDQVIVLPAYNMED